MTDIPSFQCHAILWQYVRLLYSGQQDSSSEPDSPQARQAQRDMAERYKRLIPSLRALHQDYGLGLDVTFQVLRPKLLWQLNVSHVIWSDALPSLIINPFMPTSIERKLSGSNSNSRGATCLPMKFPECIGTTQIGNHRCFPSCWIWRYQLPTIPRMRTCE